MYNDIIYLYRNVKTSNENEDRCFECQLRNPTLASINYGVFLCFLCANIQRTSLDKESSFVIELCGINSKQLEDYFLFLKNEDNKKLKSYLMKYDLMQTPDGIVDIKDQLINKYNTKSAKN